MNILAIETSCDETAVSIIKATGDFPDATYEILSNALLSQIDIHREYGGVFPMMAKREHSKAITPLLEKVLEEAEMSATAVETLPEKTAQQIQQILEREENLADTLINFLEKYSGSEINLIAVTVGPGLEPALWVGVNVAKALALAWDIPIIPTNHMEGHILATIFDTDKDDQLSEIAFPAISLLISGGHTELILMNKWGQYEKIGQTRDDAVGEAFDKVARLIGLPYPGGPEISKLAAQARFKNLPAYKENLPRPMINSGDLDFSFSGLKTAVRYAVADKDLNDENKMSIARDFEDAAVAVLLQKSIDACDRYNAKTLIVGGGVSANKHLRQTFQEHFLNSDIEVHFPMPGLSTDNSIMIALAGHAKALSKITATAALDTMRADGKKSL